MKRLVLSLVLCFFLPTLTCNAGMTEYKGTAKAMPQGSVDKHDLNAQSPDFIEIRYVFSNLRISAGNGPEVKISHPSQQNVENFAAICNSINEATRLDDLQPVLSENYFQSLKAKAKAGVSQYVILSMLQAMRPQKIHIIDFLIEGNRAQLAVAGKSYFGQMQGLIHLVRREGGWKIEDENWQAGDKTLPQEKDPVYNSIHSSSARNIYGRETSPGLFAELSPGYTINKNFLLLTKIPNHRRKQSFMFVVLMNKYKVDSKEMEVLGAEQEIADPHALLKRHPRNRVHVLWTGPKKMLPQQRVIENKYPVDVSIAKYDDGYAEDELNLVLPNKKPREVVVSWLWAF